MGILIRLIQIAAISVGISLVVASDAAAYIDLGTGSYVLQALIGGLMVGLFVLKSYWNKLKGFLGLTTSDSNQVRTPTSSDRKI
jgi:hypothetical protein